MRKKLVMITTLVVLAAAIGAQQMPSTQMVSGSSPLLRQTQAQADAKSSGCMKCHKGIEPMHASAAVKLGCTDCHGGDANATEKNRAHVIPRNPEFWVRNGKPSSANPERLYTRSMRESAEFIKFVNPGDLRVAQETCGGCHQGQTNAVPRSTMTTAAVFWAAAPYANGILGRKEGLLGESYNRAGNPQALKPITPPTPYQIARGALPLLVPMPQWTVIQPGEYFRAFERGGIANNPIPPEIGNPTTQEESGRPDIRLSNRGRGTGLRISPAVINIHKTRLNDPHLSYFGTNENPGDYRASGCSGCHVVYANDRDPLHSGGFAEYGNNGLSASGDVTIPKNEKGHPIKHQLTRAVPTSQCMSCHMHQPNSFVNTYLGYIMWDYESDAELLWPKQQKYPTEAEKREVLARNPEGAAPRGLWSNIEFLENVSKLNSQAKDTQFADYHGHGWNFMAVFKKDRKGNLLDKDGNVIPFDDAQKFSKAVHLRDIHLEKGMHCVDCHFSQDEHGNGQLYAEYGNTIEIECQDCHGTTNGYANLRTSGPAAPVGGTDLRSGTTPFGQRRFVWSNGTLLQRSMVNPKLQWEVRQVKDSITPGNPHYNARSAYAKTIQNSEGGPAHSDAKMTCYACHTSWMTSCSGCHLPQEQNQKTEMQHYEGIDTRNYATYNPQVIRTDTIMLGINGTTKGHRIAPVRSSSALVLSSTNAFRQRIYIQQPPISAPGYSSQAFNAHVPHTVRTKETMRCGDCHITEANDNNAWMAQLLLQGTNFVNFIGRYVWVAAEEAIEAVAVTEWDEPQAVIGSSLHKTVYPDYYAAHQKNGMKLKETHEHPSEGARSIQMRGEWAFVAMGENGFHVYDIANIDNKDASERIVSGPVSPVGQRTFVKTKFASAVALPTTMPVDPARKTDLIPENQEQPMHDLYRYAYIADREEGLVMVDVTTLTDANPSNNFFKRDVVFNPDGALDGANSIYVAGRWVFIGAKNGLAIVDVDKPTQPRLVSTIPEIHSATGIGVQFRYAFATDEKGLHVIDITDPARPRIAAHVDIEDAKNVYVARTYAYVAAGKNGLVIVDVEKPERPFIDQTLKEDLHDVHDVKVANTNASAFAYVADGEEGLKIFQLTSPQWTPWYQGFSPRPVPKLIATRKLEGPALAISKGLDRDRAVDESGYQVSVFNRIGARPMTLGEMQRLFLRDGKLYTVRETPNEVKK